MKPTLTLLLAINMFTGLQAEPWVKHLVMEKGRNTTALSADFTGDQQVDVMTSYAGKVSLFIAPDWEEVVVHELSSPRAQSIHSEAMDVDGDGDIDWIGGEPFEFPIWLENPGKDVTGNWKPRVIDRDIQGFHCVLKADVNQDGRDDLIINSFKPEGTIPSSIAWFSIPKNVKTAETWDRHVFANGDAIGGSHYFGVGDVDGDGWQDISTGAKGSPFEGGNWFAYWKHPGASNVEAPWEKVIVSENQIGATNMLPGDLNGDSQTDFLASRGHSRGVLWFEGPDWVEHVIDAEIESPHSLVLADFDEDGDLDGASCGFASKRLSIYLNDGSGQFEQIDLDKNQKSYDLRAVDMDADGDLDLLNAGLSSKNIVWYENPLR